MKNKRMKILILVCGILFVATSCAAKKTSDEKTSKEYVATSSEEMRNELETATTLSTSMSTTKSGVVTTKPTTTTKKPTTTRPTTKTTVKTFSVEDFVSLAKGWWAYPNEGNCEIMHIYDNKLQTGVYPGSYDRDCIITKVTKDGDYYTLDLLYPEMEMYGEVFEEETGKTIILLGPSDNNLSIIFESTDITYEYVGETYEDMSETCNDMLNLEY